MQESSTERYWHGCRDKRPYPDFDAAKSALLMLKKKGNKSLSAYKCRFCAAWHLGRTKKNNKVRNDLGAE